MGCSEHTTCPVCGQVHTVYYQPGLRLDDGYFYAHCQNVSCDLFMVTLVVGTHAQLTPERIADYAAMNARQRRAA